jgi:hypothetical protein
MATNVKNVYLSSHTTDGINDEYQIYGLTTTDPSHCLVSLNKATLSFGRDYTILPNFKVKFTTTPSANLPVDIYSFATTSKNVALDDKDNVTCITKTTHITDGVTNTYRANGAVVTPENCIVMAGAGFSRSGYIYQHNKDYTINNNNIVFNTTPPVRFTVIILVFSSNQFDIKGGVSARDNVSVVRRHDLVADGIRDTYTISGGTSNKSLYCLVAFNGRMLDGGTDYIVSHNRVKFKSKPSAGVRLTFVIFGAADPVKIPKSLTNRVRYLDKSNNLNERTLYRNYWREQISHYGLTVNYYTNLTTKSNADVIYGEAPMAGYSEPEELNIAIKIEAETSMFSKFGYMSDTEATCYIHHDDFQEIFGPESEPKAGDLIEFTEISTDRLNYPKRGPRIMEITEKNDEVPGEINNLAGHYVWQIKMKRFDYSREKTMIPELGTTDPTETGETVPGVPNPIEDLSKQVFDYEKSLCSNDSVYGDY